MHKCATKLICFLVSQNKMIVSYMESCCRYLTKIYGSLSQNRKKSRKNYKYYKSKNKKPAFKLKNLLPKLSEITHKHKKQ